uniref:Uncharacterized protein n=1 Tax=Meloidogyne javanica TaxID=6303 RepID=A0A915LX03_MELJA
MPRSRDRERLGERRWRLLVRIGERERSRRCFREPPPAMPLLY